MNNRDYFFTLKTTKIMKTGGTLNFLKRAGAILMLVAVFASSCNKYADDFKQLNTKLDGLASSIGGMSTLTTDLASVKASVASALTAIAAIPNPTASITALQASLTTVSTNVATINTTLNSLVTTVNGLPKLADVNAIATKVSADLTTQLAVTNKAITDAVTALKANEATVQTAILKAITDNNATLEALVKGDIVANNAAIIKAIGDNNTAIAKAVADNNAAMNTLVQGDLVANNAAVNALITANNAAINTAIIGNNTAMAALIQSQITALQTALQSNTDPTYVAVAGLQTLLNAQNATLATILANTIKTVGAATITGVPQVGVVLTAAATDLASGVTIPATSLTYQWSSVLAPATTYTAISGATNSTYTPVVGDLGKTIKVSVIGTGSWAGSTTAVTSTATAAVGAMIPMTAIAIPTSATSGIYRVGVKLTAGTLTPTATSGATVTYQWISSPTQYGVYAPIAGATASTYTPVAADATTYIAVVATGTGGYYNAVTSPIVGPIQYVDVVSAGFTMLPANNTVTITLTGGTFNTVAGGLLKSQFTFLGEDATAIYNGGTLTYVSSTVVKFTTSTSFNASSTNTVTIAAAAMATQGASATAVGTTEVMLTPVGSAITGIPVPTGGATYATPTITGTGFTGTVSWSPSIAVGGTFLPATVYTATVSLTALSNYTFSGVTANSWTGTGGTVTNTAGSSSLSVVFPATSAIALPVANGVLSVAQFPLPVTGATAITTVPGTNYTGVVTWAPALAGGKFQSGTIYTATIAIVPNLGYTTTGCVAPFWSTTATGTTVTYVTSATSLTVACPVTL